MIRKLRIKLIAAAMSSLVLVLIVLFSVITFWNYNEIVQGADKILDILSENDGSFPIKDHRPGALDDLSRDGTHLSPELPYETRYFTVFLTNDNTVISVNTGKIAAVDSSTAVEYALEIVEHGQGYGFKNDYRYKIYDIGGETHIIFLDYGREMSAFRTFLLTTISVSALGLTAVLFILLFLSGRIIRPFSENYEKQKRFITDAGHELKTPLALIQGYAEGLKEGVNDDSESREFYCDVIMDEASKMNQMVKNLLTLNQLEFGNDEVKFARFDIAALVRGVIASCDILIQQAGASGDFVSEEKVYVWGDEFKTEQVVRNYLTNAIHHVGNEKRIEVKIVSMDGKVCVSVFNSGKPIPEEDVPKL